MTYVNHVYHGCATVDSLEEINLDDGDAAGVVLAAHLRRVLARLNSRYERGLEGLSLIRDDGPQQDLSNSYIARSLSAVGRRV